MMCRAVLFGTFDIGKINVGGTSGNPKICFGLSGTFPLCFWLFAYYDVRRTWYVPFSGLPLCFPYPMYYFSSSFACASLSQEVRGEFGLEWWFARHSSHLPCLGHARFLQTHSLFMVVPSLSNLIYIIIAWFWSKDNGNVTRGGCCSGL